MLSLSTELERLKWLEDAALKHRLGQYSFTYKFKMSVLTRILHGLLAMVGCAPRTYLNVVAITLSVAINHKYV